MILFFTHIAALYHIISSSAFQFDCKIGSVNGELKIGFIISKFKNGALNYYSSKLLVKLFQHVNAI